MQIKTNYINYQRQFWLYALAASLISIHLHLVWRTNDNDLLSCSLLFWATLIYIFSEQRKSLKFNSNLVAVTIGSLLINLVLVKSLNIFGNDIFLRILPLISVLGWGLLASGFSVVKQYWQAIALLGFLAIPWEFIYLLVDLSLWTAKFSTFILQLLGFAIERQKLMIIFPTGSIEVYNGCSGLRMMIQLLGIALILLVVLNPQLKYKLLIPAIAIILGFMINGIRVAIMAIFVAIKQPKAFDYWHVGNGSLVFSILGVAILGLICFPLLKNEN